MNTYIIKSTAIGLFLFATVIEAFPQENNSQLLSVGPITGTLVPIKTSRVVWTVSDFKAEKKEVYIPLLKSRTKGSHLQFRAITNSKKDPAFNIGQPFWRSDSIFLEIAFNPKSIGTFLDTVKIALSKDVKSLYLVILKGENSSNTSGHSLDQGSETSIDTKLLHCYPNPFSTSANISVHLKKSGLVTLDVYNMQGMKIATLVNNQVLEAGTYQYQFDGTSLPPGMYLVQLARYNYPIETVKILLTK